MLQPTASFRTAPLLLLPTICYVQAPRLNLGVLTKESQDTVISAYISGLLRGPMGPPAAGGGPRDRARENPTPGRNSCSGGSGERETGPLSAAHLRPFQTVVRPATAASSSLQSSPSGFPVGTPSADHRDLAVTTANAATAGTAAHRSPLQRRRRSPPRQERIQGQWLKQQRADYDTSPTRAATAPSVSSTAARVIATPERRGGVRTAPSVPKTPTRANSSDDIDFPHRTCGLCEERNTPSFVCRGWGKPPTTPTSITQGKQPFHA